MGLWERQQWVDSRLRLGPIPPRRWSAMSRQLTYARASDEHGRLTVSAATNRLGLGDKIRLIPGH